MSKKESRAEKILNKFCNIYGFPLSVESRKLIKNYLYNPTHQNWNSIHGVVIWNAPVINIWTQVCHCNPHLDVTGRVFERGKDGEWEQKTEWNRIPAPLELIVSLEKFFAEDNNEQHTVTN
jgi:hypothetical protein